MPVDQARLRAINATATKLRAGLRYGEPPAQRPALTEDERRAQSPTAHLWPVFRSPGEEAR